jgi:hypothetical protein
MTEDKKTGTNKKPRRHISGADAREQWEDNQEFDFTNYVTSQEVASADTPSQQEAVAEMPAEKGPDRYKRNLFDEDNFRTLPR